MSLLVDEIWPISSFLPNKKSTEPLNNSHQNLETKENHVYRSHKTTYAFLCILHVFGMAGCLRNPISVPWIEKGWPLTSVSGVTPNFSETIFFFSSVMVCSITPPPPPSHPFFLLCKKNCLSYISEGMWPHFDNYWDVTSTLIKKNQ